MIWRWATSLFCPTPAGVPRLRVMDAGQKCTSRRPGKLAVYVKRGAPHVSLICSTSNSTSRSHMSFVQESSRTHALTGIQPFVARFRQGADRPSSFRSSIKLASIRSHRSISHQTTAHGPHVSPPPGL